MNPQISRGSRDLLLPATIALVGWAVAGASWWALIQERRHSVLESTAEVADESSLLVTKAVDSYLRALDELARYWAFVGRQPLDHWRADLEMLLGNFPALEYVAWLDAEGSDHRISPEARSRATALSELETARTPLRRPVLVPARDGLGPLLRISFPVGAGGESGVLVSGLDLEPVLAEALTGVFPDYAVRISWDDELLFARGRTSSDPWQDWWRTERTAELPQGVAWQIVHRPTPQLAAARLTPVPHYLLVSGLVLSLLLAALAHQLRMTLRQSRSVEASNRALERRGDDLERRVAARTRELEEAVTELRAFNQTISHDLRSPLSAVLNFTAILEEDHLRGLDEEGRQILERIQRSAARAILLLEDLLELSRAGQAALDIAPVDMRGLAEEIFAQVRAAENDADVEFVLEDLPEIEGDRGLLGNVFANLFTNALKYSRGCEKRRVTVRATHDGDQCVFEVADNGRGFDMRFRDKLFGVFERLDPDDGVEGTGAGLAIVERIVRRHGGRVSAEGRPGKGACFRFALPRTQGIRR